MEHQAHGGPRTDEGKARCSANSTTHGLRSSSVLLPGEDEAAYAALLEDVLNTVAPVGEAEVRATAALADMLWLEGRWLRAFQRSTAETLEDTVTKSKEWASATGIRNTLIALNALLESTDTLGTLSENGVEPLVGGARRIATMLSYDVELPPRLSAAFDAAVGKLHAARTDSQRTQALADLRATAKRARRRLVTVSKRAEKALTELKVTLASVAMPADMDAKKLSRYSKMIATATEGQIRIINGLREQRLRAQRSRRNDPSPLGHGVTPSEVRLRVIR